MKNQYKTLSLFIVVLIAVFFATESLLNLWFEDQTPLWKILAVSIISAAATVWPMLKKGEPLQTKQLFKNQKVSFNCPLLPNSFFEQLSKFLVQKNFIQLRLKAENELHFRSKPHFNSFGERYVIKYLDGKITLRSSSIFYLDFMDGGFAHKNVTLLEQSIQQLLEEK